MILSGNALEIHDREVDKTHSGREAENRKVTEKSNKTQGG